MFSSLLVSLSVVFSHFSRVFLVFTAFFGLYHIQFLYLFTSRLLLLFSVLAFWISGFRALTIIPSQIYKKMKYLNETLTLKYLEMALSFSI